MRSCHGKPESSIIADSAIFNYHVLQYANIFAGIFSIITNAIVAYAFYKLRYYKKTHHRLSIILMVTDIFTTITLHPLFAYWSYILGTGAKGCSVRVVIQTLQWISIFLSAPVIVFINVHQYIHIVHPYLVDHVHCRFWHILLGLALIWCLLIVFVIVGFRVYEISKELVGPVGFVMTGIFLILCYLQWRISFESRNISNRNKAQQLKQARAEDQRLRRRTYRMAQSVLIVFGVCFLPFLTRYILVNVANKKQKRLFSRYISMWFFFIANLNPMLDPIIYCIRLKSVRNFLIKSCGWNNRDKEKSFLGTNSEESQTVSENTFYSMSSRRSSSLRLG